MDDVSALDIRAQGVYQVPKLWIAEPKSRDECLPTSCNCSLDYSSFKPIMWLIK